MNEADGTVRVTVELPRGGMTVWGPIVNGDIADAIDRAKEQILRAGKADK